MENNKLQLKKDKLEETLKNNIHKLSIDEVNKIMNIIKGDNETKIKNTTNKLNDNKKIKVAKKDKVDIEKSTKKVLSINKKLFKNVKTEGDLSDKDFEIIRKNVNNVLGEKNKLVLKKNNKTFKNVATSTKYKLKRFVYKYANKRNLKVYDYEKKGKEYLRLDLPNYLKLCKEKVLSDTNLLAGQFDNSIKIIFRLYVELKNLVKNNNNKQEWIYQDVLFSSNNSEKMIVITNVDQLNIQYDLLNDKFFTRIDTFLQQGSGWTYSKIHHFQVDVVRYVPFRGRSYIPTPEYLENKRLVNPQNDDNKCFKWAMLAGLFYDELKNNRHRISKLKEYENRINTSFLNYPVDKNQIQNFEQMNNIPVNIFIYEDKDIKLIHGHSISSENKIINLLLLEEGEKNHYLYIPSISALIREGGNNTYYPCDKCLQRFSTEQAYNNHIVNHKCMNFKGEAFKILPNEKNNFIMFKNIQKRIKLPFTIYMDSEAMLQNVNKINKKVETYQLHKCQHVGIILISQYPELLPEYQIYKSFYGDDCMINSLNYILEIYEKAQYIIHTTNIKMKITDDQEKEFKKSTHCYLCLQKFFDENDECYKGKEDKKNKDKINKSKVRDHDHLNGLYRGPTHNECNLTNNVKKYFKLPVIAHNMKGYDSHFIFQQLGKLKRSNGIDYDISGIPLTIEKYLSFNIDNIVFLDSYQFISTSLDKLVEGLNKAKNISLFKNFNNEFNNISDELNDILRQKNVFPYDFYNNKNKLNETKLPSIKEFYNTLNNEECKKEDYERALKVYDLSGCKSFSDYIELYLKTDVLLLADCFENFRETCYKFYGLDVCQYYTAPGFSWDSMLLGYYKKVEIENHTYNLPIDKRLIIKLFKEGEEDMLDMIKNNMRGGISIITHRHSVANNKYMKNYNKNKESKYLGYFDANNLYGWAMSQFLPNGNYKWNNDITLQEILRCGKKSYTGYIIECDLEYPKHLHNKHNDYPLAVENTSFKDSPYMEDLAMKNNVNIKNKCDKLIPNLFNKTKYVLHYRNLQLYVNLGLKVKKIHRVLQFNQSPYLEDYIMFNTNMRTKTKLDYEKDLFKLFNNAIFGKTMENVEHRIDVRFVNSENKFLKQVNKPYYKGHKIFSNNLAAIHLNKTNINYDKPVICGFSILELSKNHMYNFHYNIMKKKYGDNIKLLATDTDSLIYEIKTDDMYEDIKNINQYFDCSEYPENHKCYDETNKKVIGKFKDEASKTIMNEFIGIRSKMYKFSCEGIINPEEKDILKQKSQKGTAKGIKKQIAEKIEMDDYRNCLYNNEKNKYKTVKFNLIRQNLHNLKSIKIEKTGLSSYDDKRYYLDSVNSRSHGHFLN